MLLLTLVDLKYLKLNEHRINFSFLLRYRIGTLVAADRIVFPPGTPAAVFTYNSDLSQIKDGVNFTDWTQVCDVHCSFFHSWRRPTRRRSRFVCAQDSTVDWNKPFFWQVDKLREAYFEWITVPVDRPLRFFQWDVMEVLTHCSWYVVPLVWLPVVTLLTWLAHSWISNPAVARDTRSIMPWLAGGALLLLLLLFLFCFLFLLAFSRSRVLNTSHTGLHTTMI